jgi:hypothetical protein
VHTRLAGRSAPRPSAETIAAAIRAGERGDALHRRPVSALERRDALRKQRKRFARRSDRQRQQIAVAKRVVAADRDDEVRHVGGDPRRLPRDVHGRRAVDA